MRRNMTVCVLVLVAVVHCAWPSAGRPEEAAKSAVFRAGAAAVDITPDEFPVLVCGGFLSKTAEGVSDRLHARCLVLDNRATRLAIVVVDSCLLPAELLDEAKRHAQAATGIAADRILISATHTHSAPAAMGALGTDVDPNYPRFFLPRLVEVIEVANRRLAPARAGSAVVEDFEHTNCRRWILRPDRIETDPFGEQTVRAMMHPGYQSPNHVGPAGPIDPYLTVLSVQTAQGRPIALVANYSQHYYGGVKPLSADYYGRFAQRIEQSIGAGDPAFVAIMSQGTSGDLHWMDYSRTAKPRDIDAYAEAMAQVAYRAYRTIKHKGQVPLAMCERKLTLKRRLPNEARLAWAKDILAAMPRPAPTNRVEVYAREQIYLHEEPVRTITLQALRIGDLGIAAIPCEVYGITGLKIKLQSPLWPTMNFELANGAEGYIPPPEQHALGGYTTWPARTAALEVEAEPKIVETVLGLLEEVSGTPRQQIVAGQGAYAKEVLASKPVAYWRMAEIVGPEALDTAASQHGVYEDGVAFYLDGPQSAAFCGEALTNRASRRPRAAHFAGGRMRAAVDGLGSRYSVEMWFSNGLPADARPVTGYLFSCGADRAKGAPGEHLGICGTRQADSAGKLLFCIDDTRRDTLIGRSRIDVRTWNHVVMVRDGGAVAVYLNGDTTPEISGEAAPGYPDGVTEVFVGGRSDNLFNFEGKISEVALYNRALTDDEVARHYQMARLNQKTP